ncbi:MAG TPA: hypothetical protein VF438_03510 [Candidatus Paceibacterota bacterium]
MTQKNFNTIVGVLLVLNALFHLWLILAKTPIILGDVAWPMWMNWAALIVSLVLGFYGLKHGRKR